MEYSFVLTLFIIFSLPLLDQTTLLNILLQQDMNLMKNMKNIQNFQLSWFNSKFNETWDLGSPCDREQTPINLCLNSKPINTKFETHFKIWRTPWTRWTSKFWFQWIPTPILLKLRIRTPNCVEIKPQYFSPSKTTRIDDLFVSSSFQGQQWWIFQSTPIWLKSRIYDSNK